MSFTLAIVGRPNVGKSTLFNRLIGQKLALVDNQPGVTRDLREGDARLGGLPLRVLDTAGLEAVKDDSLPGRMRKLTERAIAEADAALFLVDARAGVTPLDQELADMLRRADKPVFLALNKAEGRHVESALAEGWALGLGEPIAMSAEHGEGLAELAVALAPFVDRHQARATVKQEKPLQIAVVGRPNAGKSTLINRIIGEDRLLTGPEAGITRDAIALTADWNGLKLRIFDTAGMRKKARVTEKLEKLSVSDGLRAVRFAEVVIVTLDATIPFETQDLRIADLAEREGRAVVIALNKWDLIEGGAAALTALRQHAEKMLPQLRGVEIIAVSAVTGQGMDRLAQAVERAAEIWNRRVPTAALNRWLDGMIGAHPPPAPGGHRIKLRYMTQPKARPPSFVLMCSRPSELPASYRRYLVSGLREAFDLPGIPIRLVLRSQAEKNPYQGRKKKQPSKLSKHLKRP